MHGLIQVHTGSGKGKTAAALGMTLVEAALRALREIKTFAEAGILEGSGQ